MVNRMGGKTASRFQILSVVSSSRSLSAQCGQEKEKLQIIEILDLKNPSPVSTKPRSKKSKRSFLLERAR